jgi:hypothetical protein
MAAFFATSASPRALLCFSSASHSHHNPVKFLYDSLNSKPNRIVFLITPFGCREKCRFFVFFLVNVPLPCGIELIVPNLESWDFQIAVA